MNTDYMSAALELLQRMDVRLAHIEQQLASRGRQASLSQADRTALAALFPAIVGRWEEEVVFSSRDAIDHVRESPEVLGPLLTVLRELDAGAPRRLGKLFGRADGTVIDGLSVHRGVSTRDGLLWRLRRV